MAELYCDDPELTLDVINGILEDGDQAELLIVLRQLAQAFGGVQAVGGGAGAFESDATLSDVVPGRESCVEQFDGDGVAVGCEVGGGC